MKAILMSIRPEWVAKILNGEKTIEIRKKFPSDYVGWVYIYCTKGKTTFEKTLARYHDGKVVARFWCDKVEEIESCQVPFTYEQWFTEYWTKTFSDMEDLLKASCLDYYTLDKYLEYSKTGFAIHITKLEIFNKPKEIRDFVACKYGKPIWKPLTRAPQSFMFIEV